MSWITFYNSIKQDYDNTNQLLASRIQPIIDSMVGKKLFELQKQKDNQNATSQLGVVGKELGLPEEDVSRITGLKYTDTEGKTQPLNPSFMEKIVENKISDKENKDKLIAQYPEAWSEVPEEQKKGASLSTLSAALPKAQKRIDLKKEISSNVKADPLISKHMKKGWENSSYEDMSAYYDYARSQADYDRSIQKARTLKAIDKAYDGSPLTAAQRKDLSLSATRIEQVLREMQSYNRGQKTHVNFKKKGWIGIDKLSKDINADVNVQVYYVPEQGMKAKFVHDKSLYEYFNKTLYKDGEEVPVDPSELTPLNDLLYGTSKDKGRGGYYGKMLELEQEGAKIIGLTGQNVNPYAQPQDAPASQGNPYDKYKISE